MATREEIIGQAARERTAERLIPRVARRRLDADTVEEVAQRVYEVLLTSYDGDKVLRAAREGHLERVICSVARNIMRPRGSYTTELLAPARNTVDITAHDFPDDEQ